MTLLQKAAKTKEIWMHSLKRELFPFLLKCYADDFIFKGTYCKKSTTDKYDLSKYFKNFTKEATGVTFFKNNITLVKNNMVFDTGRYNFKTNKGLIKAHYLMVFDEKGKIIVHYSNFYD